MPTFEKRKSSKGLFFVDVLKKAFAAIRSEVLSIRKATLKYKVNRSTFQRYSKKFGDPVKK